MNVFTSMHLVLLLKKNYLFGGGWWGSRALQEFSITDTFSATWRCLPLRQRGKHIQVHIQIAVIIKMKSQPHICRSSLQKCIKKKKLSASHQPKQVQELLLPEEILHKSLICLEAVLICFCNYLLFLLVCMSVHIQCAELHIRSKV